MIMCRTPSDWPCFNAIAMCHVDNVCGKLDVSFAVLHDGYRVSSQCWLSLVLYRHCLCSVCLLELKALDREAQMIALF